MINSEKGTEVVTVCGESSLKAVRQLVCEVQALGLARGHYTPRGLTENGGAIYTSYKKKNKPLSKGSQPFKSHQEAGKCPSEAMRPSGSPTCLARRKEEA